MSNMSTHTSQGTASTAPASGATTTLNTRTPPNQPPYMHPLNLTHEQYRSLRELIKSRLTLDSPGLLGARPERLHSFNKWFTELLEQDIVPAYFSNEEGVYWGRSSDMIAKAVRTCVLRISASIRRGITRVRGRSGRTGLPSDQFTAIAPAMGTMNPSYIFDTANLQVQDGDFYPEEYALSPGEYQYPLGRFGEYKVNGGGDVGGFEEFMANGGGDVEGFEEYMANGYFNVPDGGFAPEFFQDGEFESSGVMMEGYEFASGGNGDAPAFTFGFGGEAA